MGYQLPLTVLPVVVDHEFDGRIETSARRFALTGFDYRENRIGQRIGYTKIGQFRSKCLNQHPPGSLFDDKTPYHDLFSQIHQGAGGEINDLAIASSRFDIIHLDNGNSGSSVLSFNSGRIPPGIEGENGRGAQAATRQVWTATPNVGYQLLLTVLPVVVDHEFDGCTEFNTRRFALTGLNDRENRIGQRIGYTKIGQFRADCLNQHLPGSLFDDKTPYHDLLSCFH